LQFDPYNGDLHKRVREGPGYFQLKSGESTNRGIKSHSGQGARWACRGDGRIAGHAGKQKGLPSKEKGRLGSIRRWEGNGAKRSRPGQSSPISTRIDRRLEAIQGKMAKKGLGYSPNEEKKIRLQTPTRESLEGWQGLKGALIKKTYGDENSDQLGCLPHYGTR